MDKQIDTLGRPLRSATKRMTQARDATLEANTRELLLAIVLGTRAWPSFVARPAREDAMFPWLLCIDSPAGRLSYKLRDTDMPLVGHLTHHDKPDTVPCSQLGRSAILLHLAIEDY